MVSDMDAACPACVSCPSLLPDGTCGGVPLVLIVLLIVMVIPSTTSTVSGELSTACDGAVTCVTGLS